MKTIYVSYNDYYYCPNCKALYFSEVDCHCLNNLKIKENSQTNEKKNDCSLCHPENMCKKHKIEQAKIITELSKEISLSNEETK